MGKRLMALGSQVDMVDGAWIADAGGIQERARLLFRNHAIGPRHLMRDPNRMIAKLRKDHLIHTFANMRRGDDQDLGRGAPHRPRETFDSEHKRLDAASDIVCG